jgi:hypothetical protein
MDHRAGWSLSEYRDDLVLRHEKPEHALLDDGNALCPRSELCDRSRLTQVMVQLPEGHFWHLYGGGGPNHFSMETVWSENSRSMLAIYDSRWSTDTVFVLKKSSRQEKSSEAGERFFLELAV